MSKSTSGLIVFSAADVTEHHEQVEAMQQQATSDPLTGLPNRVALDEFTTAMLKHSERSGEVAAIMAIDLDGFKPVNDTHGHHAGDELLREIATRMQEEARETDFVARVGGDEFIIVLLHLEDGNGALRFGQRLLRAIEMPVTLEDGTEVHVSASAGISLFPYHGREAQPLCVLADMALYEAKGKGRNAVVMYELPETQAVNVLTTASSAS
jgi:diguanylate cyclase (GGDEF)-like protein